MKSRCHPDGTDLGFYYYFIPKSDRAPRGGVDAVIGALELQLGLGYPVDHQIYPGVTNRIEWKGSKL